MAEEKKKTVIKKSGKSKKKERSPEKNSQDQGNKWQDFLRRHNPKKENKS